MKRTFLFIACLIGVTLAQAKTETPVENEFENQEIVSTADKKSPWASGIMSYFIPGLGQMYNGEFRKGLVDFTTQVGGYAALSIGGYLIVANYGHFDDTGYYIEGNKSLSTTGGVLLLGGIITIYANTIHSIIDAVKSSKRINTENGYIVYEFNEDLAFGMQPSIVYERPQYVHGSKAELSAGMKFKLTF